MFATVGLRLGGHQRTCAIAGVALRLTWQNVTRDVSPIWMFADKDRDFAPALIL